MTMSLHHADCLEWLGALAGRIAAGEAEAFDSCVTDPPYHLTSIVRRFGKEGSAPARAGKAANHTRAYARASKGFMGVDLMRWLVRMVTPPGGHVLEPFAGSGTTGIACMAEGFDCTMIELEKDHVADIARKLAVLRGEGRLKFIEHDRRREERDVAEMDLGLFAGIGAA